MTVPASPLLSVRAYRARSSGHLAAVLLLLSACSKPDAPLPPPTPRIVQVATVSEGPAEPQIVVSGLEHHANLVPWQQAARRTGAVLRMLLPDAQGRLHAADLRRLLGRPPG